MALEIMTHDSWTHVKGRRRREEDSLQNPKYLAVQEKHGDLGHKGARKRNKKTQKPCATAFSI